MEILKRAFLPLLAAILVSACIVEGLHAKTQFGSGEFLILCYHGIQPTARPNDPYTLTQQRFAQQMEYLHAHGYNPVSLAQIEAALNGKKPLPDKAVLLTFDDAYRSYHDFVVPLLDFYGFPSMVALVGSWIENGPPNNITEPVMTWEQLRTVAANPLVTVVSHSFDLHKNIQYTPQGNFGSAVGARAYDSIKKTYESERAYRERLRKDFERQNNLFVKRLGYKPRAIVWPYGYDNSIGMEIAAESGIRMGFVLDDKNTGKASLDQPIRLHRKLVFNEPLYLFIYVLNHLGISAAPMRGVQVDLDLIYIAGDAQQTSRNLDRLIDRLMALKVNTVFLQAFADPDGSGNISSVYFHNRVLPVRADIFAQAVNQMHIRGIKVFAWMPTLSIVFEDETFNERFRVREYKNGSAVPSSSWYRRLTPFSEEVAQKVAMLYEDLAAGSLISGILFQDDAYLTDFEDFHPLAIDAFAAHINRKITPEQMLADRELSDEWMRFKTDRLIFFTDALTKAVRKYRPDAFFARNLYARTVSDPCSEKWFAQNYDKFLEHYDYAVIMAYPQMEKAGNPIKWLKDLVRVAARPRMPEKTVFKLQAYDWRGKKWISDSLLLKAMRAVLAAGGRHLAYYPDNFWEEKPDLEIIKLEMSTRDTLERK